jgi:hypothetical protein
MDSDVFRTIGRFQFRIGSFQRRGMQTKSQVLIQTRITKAGEEHEDEFQNRNTI